MVAIAQSEVYSEVSIVVPHIKLMLEVCLWLAQDKDGVVEDSLKIKAITFLGRLTSQVHDCTCAL